MLAVLLIISILSGALAVGMTQVLSLPLWTAILAYPLGGIFGLLFSAALLRLEPVGRHQPTRFGMVNAAALHKSRQR